MLSGEPISLPAAASDEAKAYLRIEGAGEDGLVARLMRSSAELCEAFTGQALLARGFTETLPRDGTWTRLAATPVRAIAGIEALSADGEGIALDPGAYAVDIDANGDGWVRLLAAPGRARVSFDAGMTSQWEDLPEALRQGIVRLAAHSYTHRAAAEEGGPPAAVAALWRPWRRMRLR